MRPRTIPSWRRLIRRGETGGGLGPGAIEEARQRRQLRAEGPELPPTEVLVPPQNPPPVDLVHRLLLPPRPAAVDDGGVEGLHRFQGVGEVRRCLAQVLVEAAVAFLPGGGAVALELFREAGAHQRVGVEGLRLPRIGRRQQAVVPQGGDGETASLRPRDPPAAP